MTVSTCAGRERIGILEIVLYLHAEEACMNEAKKLTLSKETLRCLDDTELTGVVGGWNRHGGNSNDCNNSNNCYNNSDVCSGVCISFECNSIALGICL
jgi:hypothetical protein